MKSKEDYGFLTELLPAKEKPILGAPTRIIHGVRNAIFSLPGLDMIQGVANTII